MTLLRLQHCVAYRNSPHREREDKFFLMFSEHYLAYCVHYPTWHIICKCRPAMTVERNQIAQSNFILRLTRGTLPRRVLCWVSSSERKDSVVHIAEALSKSCQGQCVTVMCLDSPVKKPLTPEVIGQTGTNLSKLYGDEIHTMVLPGHPITEIRRYARTRNIDLIVMGEQALAVEMAYGERLLDDAPCMVIVLALPNPEENPSTNRPANRKSGQMHKR